MNTQNIFLSLLQVAFIVLKLTGTIDWTWFWVLSPIIIPTAIGLILIAIAKLL